MSSNHTISVFTLVFLLHGDDVLLLHRAPHKRLWPNRWTGVGGGVDSSEMGDLEAAALREVAEETGLLPADIDDFALRLTAMRREPNGDAVILACCTGTALRRDVVDCDEGTLVWVSRAQLFDRDLLPAARLSLPYLLRWHDARTNVTIPRCGVLQLGTDGQPQTLLLDTPD